MNAGRGCEERGTLMHYWWEYKLMHLLQRPKLWPLDLKSQLIGKDPPAGKE